MLVSLALHALLLFALPMLKEAKRQLPVKLTARLAHKPPEPVPPRAEPPPPQMRPAPIPPVVRPAPVAKAVVPAPPVTPPIPSVEPAKQASEPVFVVPVAPSSPAAPSASPPSAGAARFEAQPASSGLDAGAVARFRLELMDLARRYKRYPRIAQDNGWEGRVELRIAIGEDGAISALTVKKGTGRAALDDEAQAMIRTAKSKVTIPPALLGKAFVIEIPVDFFLKE